jgi:hypothetical protein
VHGRLAGHRVAGRPGEVLQPLRQVHRVADHRVLEALGAAQQRSGHLAGGDPDAQPERREPLAGPLLVEIALPGVHGNRRAHRAGGVCRVRVGRTEHRHDCIPDVLHHRPALGEDCSIHLLPMRVELAGEHGGIACFGDPRVAAHVRHEDGDGKPFRALNR